MAHKHEKKIQIPTYLITLTMIYLVCVTFVKTVHIIKYDKVLSRVFSDIILTQRAHCTNNMVHPKYTAFV